MKTEIKCIERKIQSLFKPMDIKHKGIVFSILEYIDLKIATGNNACCLSLFSVDYGKNKYTKFTEHEEHDSYLDSLCELVLSSIDCILKVWNISNGSFSYIKTSAGCNNNVNKVISFTNDIIVFC